MPRVSVAPRANTDPIDDQPFVSERRRRRPLSILRLAALLSVLTLTSALALSLLTTRYELGEGRSVRLAPPTVD